MDEVVRRARQARRRSRASPRRAQESLAPFAAHAVVLHVAEQADAVERTGTHRGRRLAPSSLGDDGLDLGARQDVAGQALEQPVELEVADVGRDLGQVLVRDLGRGLVDRFLQAMLVAALVGAQRRQALADRHQVARPEQGVPADVLEGVFLLVRVDVATPERPRKASSGCAFARARAAPSGRSSPGARC